MRLSDCRDILVSDNRIVSANGKESSVVDKDVTRSAVEVLRSEGGAALKQNHQ